MNSDITAIDYAARKDLLSSIRPISTIISSQYVNDNQLQSPRNLTPNRIYAIHTDSNLNNRPDSNPATYFSFQPYEDVSITSVYRAHFFMTYNHLYYGLDYGNQNILWQKLANFSDINQNNQFDLRTPKSIILIGDSITQGVGSSDASFTGETIQCGNRTTKRNIGSKSWAAKFIKLITERYGCECDNNAISGINMIETLDGLDDLITKNYDYAIVMIGTNDRGRNYSDYLTASYSLISAIKNKGIIPFLFSPIDVYTEGEDQRTFVTTPEMQQIAHRAVAKTFNINFYPMLTYFTSYISKSGEGYDVFYHDTTPNTPTASDGLHPSDRGHSLIFGLFREFLNI